MCQQRCASPVAGVCGMLQEPCPQWLVLSHSSSLNRVTFCSAAATNRPSSWHSLNSGHVHSAEHMAID